jgi:hypothetical protein
MDDGSTGHVDNTRAPKEEGQHIPRSSKTSSKPELVAVTRHPGMVAWTLERPMCRRTKGRASLLSSAGETWAINGADDSRR